MEQQLLTGQVYKVVCDLPPSFFASWVRRKISACSMDKAAMAIAVSNCIVTGGPQLVTNWVALAGVTSPIGSANISISQLPLSAGERTPDLDQMTGKQCSDWQMHTQSDDQSGTKCWRWQKMYMFGVREYLCSQLRD